MIRRLWWAAAPLLVVSMVAAACGSTSNVSSSTSSNSTPVSQAAFSNQICGQGGVSNPSFTNGIPTVSGEASTLSGAGSTFVAPVMSVWTKNYASKGVQVAYQAVGSGAGVQQIQAQTIDFGDSDVPMTDAELAAAKGGTVLHIPVVIGGAVPAYNLPGVKSGLKFTGDVLGKIYAGKITTWNDPQLTQLNPDAHLPSTPIAVVHRSDGSGTTGIWTTFLTKTSQTWVTTLGGSTTSEGKTVAWPVGLGGKGNDGVSALISQTAGALGYVELQYALAQQITYGQVRNKAGNFIQPCVATVNAAAAAATFPPDLRGDLTWQEGANSYPITGTTYSLVYENQTDKAKAAALVNFFSWVLTTGQGQVAQLNYAPLGKDLQAAAVGQLKKITVNGTPVAH